MTNEILGPGSGLQMEIFNCNWQMDRVMPELEDPMSDIIFTLADSFNWRYWSCATNVKYFLDIDM